MKMRVMVALMTMLAVACVHAQADNEPPYQAADKALVEHLQKPYSGDADVDFMARMIAQHEAGIERAKSALMYGSDAKVRMMAGDLLKSLNTDLRAMKTWMATHGGKMQAASAEPQPKAMPAALPAAIPAAEKMRAAATMPVPVSASKVVTSSVPPTDAVSDTVALNAALNAISPAAGPEKMPTAPAPDQDIENTPPVMEFLDGGV